MKFAFKRSEQQSNQHHIDVNQLICINTYLYLLVCTISCVYMFVIMCEIRNVYPFWWCKVLKTTTMQLNDDTITISLFAWNKTNIPMFFKYSYLVNMTIVWFYRSANITYLLFIVEPLLLLHRYLFHFYTLKGCR